MAFHVRVDIASRCGDSARGLGSCGVRSPVPPRGISLPSQVRSHLVTPTVKWSEPYVVTNGDFTGSAAPYPYNAWLLVQGVVPRSITGIPTYREVSATYPESVRAS